jgi:aminopeptidase N
VPRRIIVVVAAVVMGVAMSGSGAQAAPFSPGAPGVGDPYFPDYGNGGYDVRHYGLQLAYDPTTDVLDGTARIRARATQGLSRFDLDFVGMNVRSIKVNGRPATWSRTAHELVVTPARGITNRSLFTVRVTYDGVPQQIDSPTLGQYGFFHTDDGAIVAGEPEAAAFWFPVNDHPRDKASYTFAVTAPAGLDVLANGTLRSSRTRADRTTWMWDARQPMASYLAFIAIGRFDVNRYRTGGVEFIDALDPRLDQQIAPPVEDDPDAPPTYGQRIRASFAEQPEILRFLTSVFGPYPFDQAGGIVDVGGPLFALETQTRPIYSKDFWNAGVDGFFAGTSTVVHELAHQWVGDLVAVDRWQDIWLNEGFATYAEFLWSERQGGPTAQDLFDVLATIPASDPFWTVVIGDPGQERLFDIAIYLRGAMALHALRLEVGERPFARILRLWAGSQRGGTATVEEFIAFAERMTGQNLDDLFQTWLYTPAKPQGIEPAPGLRASRPFAPLVRPLLKR